MKESRNHHFVPKLLLRPWLIEAQGQSLLKGYWWDDRRAQLARKERGLDSFCFQIGLLTLRSHPRGSDVIEKVFFGDIDDKGAVARNILIEHGPQELNAEKRADFARLLFSLEARRPNTIGRLRTEGVEYFKKELDSDSDVKKAFSDAGISTPPSSYVETHLGWSLEDRALMSIQRLTDDPKIGRRLINAKWAVRRIQINEGSLILSDRPLIRVHGYDQPGATWVLPLTPRAAFIACNHQDNLRKLLLMSDQRFVKEVNKSSVSQAERFVFSVDEFHATWLGKYLKKNQSAKIA